MFKSRFLTTTERFATSVRLLMMWSCSRWSSQRAFYHWGPRRNLNGLINRFDQVIEVIIVWHEEEIQNNAIVSMASFLPV